MQGIGAVEVRFVAGFGPIVRDAASSRKLYADDLSISFKEESGGYLHTEALEGAKTFALWPLRQAARSCFGQDAWPDDTPVPQAWLDVERATLCLERRGHLALVRNRQEPWGQIVSRFLSPEGLLTALTFTPALRGDGSEPTSQPPAT
jgi:hypothetical protein